MSVFVDTSAIVAFLDGDDGGNAVATAAFSQLATEDRMLTTNYVVVESATVVQRKLGPQAVRALLSDVVPMMRVTWVDEDVQRAAVSALLAAPRRRISLVDRVSFEVMRRLAVSRAFAFDRDFALEGFETVP